MAEVVYNAAGLGLPIVMTVGNRAIGAPINIWNDHSDAMALRDAGWIQLFAADNQEAADLHVQAFRIAEALSTPVMVCMDGFVLTHAFERVDVPSQEDADAFLPPFEPRQVLDPDRPVSIGALVGPDAFTEVRFLAHETRLRALSVIPEVAAEFRARFGRDSGGLVHPYRLTGAETVVVAMGSVSGTLQDAVDAWRAAGKLIGALGICTFRPFPSAAVAAALSQAREVVVHRSQRRSRQRGRPRDRRANGVHKESRRSTPSSPVSAVAPSPARRSIGCSNASNLESSSDPISSTSIGRSSTARTNAPGCPTSGCFEEPTHGRK